MGSLGSTKIYGDLIVTRKGTINSNEIVTSKDDSVMLRIYSGQLQYSTNKGDSWNVATSIEVSSDTSPQLGGELDAGENTIGFTQKNNTGTSIDWRSSNKQSKSITSSTTLSFTSPSNPCNLLLKVTGTGTLTLPSTIKWANGTTPTITVSSSVTFIISFYFDGSTYYGSAGSFS